MRVLIFGRGVEIKKEMDLEAALNYYNLMLKAAKSVNDKKGIKGIEFQSKKISKREYNFMIFIQKVQ